MPEIYRKIFRFFLSGGVSALVYYGIARFAVSHWQWSLATAGLFAYLCSMPVAYGLHRRFTFSSTGRLASEAMRFVVSSMVGLALAAALPGFFASFGMSLDVSLIVTCVCVPILSYVLLSAWVFVRLPNNV